MKSKEEPPEQTGVHYPAKSPAAMFVGTPKNLSIKCLCEFKATLSMLFAVSLPSPLNRTE